jgi:hypothetical protein
MEVLRQGLWEWQVNEEAAGLLVGPGEEAEEEGEATHLYW